MMLATGLGDFFQKTFMDDACAERLWIPTFVLYVHINQDS